MSLVYFKITVNNRWRKDKLLISTLINSCVHNYLLANISQWILTGGQYFGTLLFSMRKTITEPKYLYIGLQFRCIFGYAKMVF